MEGTKNFPYFDADSLIIRGELNKNHTVKCTFLFKLNSISLVHILFISHLVYFDSHYAGGGTFPSFQLILTQARQRTLISTLQSQFTIVEKMTFLLETIGCTFQVVVGQCQLQQFTLPNLPDTIIWEMTMQETMMQMRTKLGNKQILFLTKISMDISESKLSSSMLTILYLQNNCQSTVQSIMILLQIPIAFSLFRLVPWMEYLNISQSRSNGPTQSYS